MTLELLIQDLEKRASVIYEGIYSDLEKNGYDIPKRNSLVFNVIETDEINGGAWCLGNQDFIEINKGVIKKHYDYFFMVNDSNFAH